MAYPASTELLDNTLAQVDGIMLMVKSLSATLRQASAAGAIPSSQIIDYMARVADLRDRLSTLSATPGLGDYAKTAKQKAALDVAAEFTATLAQIDATRAWIVANFPKAADSSLSERKFDGAGRTVQNNFTTAALAGLRTQLSALEATIA